MKNISLHLEKIYDFVPAEEIVAYKKTAEQQKPEITNFCFGPPKDQAVNNDDAKQYEKSERIKSHETFTNN